jgi:hypothetical protein
VGVQLTKSKEYKKEMKRIICYYLFKGYVKAFMKIKLEASEWRNDSESVEEYRKAVKENLGIELGKIENNSGKRAVAKICLNSLWGKFGQRQNMGATEYATDIKRFYEILLDDRLDNIHINELNENMLQMDYKYVSRLLCRKLFQ